MFDIGFSEIVLIAVIALLVVGPQELPALVRSIGSWLGKARHLMSAVKTEFDREIHKADEIRRLMAKEVEVAEYHKTLDEDRRADRPKDPDRTEIPRGADTPISATSVSSVDTATPAAKQEHGTPQA